MGKAMKMSAMKMGMKKMAMKVSTKGKKWQVLKGTRLSTVGGLKKSDLKKNKYGKVVSSKASKRAAGNKWIKAIALARKSLGVKGFCAIGGKKKEGIALLAKARSFYKK